MMTERTVVHVMSAVVSAIVIVSTVMVAAIVSAATYPAWSIIVREWVIIWVIPSAVPATIVAEVPSAIPATIMEAECWRYIPPWIPIAVVPVEWVVEAYVIPWIVVITRE